MHHGTQTPFMQHFGDLADPRIDRTKLHPLAHIIVITLCAVICGAQAVRGHTRRIPPARPATEGET